MAADLRRKRRASLPARATVTPFTRQLAFASASLLGGSLMGLAVAVFIARWLGVEAFGVYGFAMAYVSLWSVLMDGGSAMVATREVARRGGLGVTRALFTLKPVLVVLAYAGLATGSRVLGFAPLAHDAVLLIGLGAGAAACLTLTLAVFRGYQEFGIESAHVVGQRLVFALLAFGTLLAQGGVLGVALAWALSWMLIMAPALWLLRRRHGLGWRPSISALRSHGRAALKAASPLLLGDALTNLHIRNAPVLLQLARGAAEVGLYTAARRLIEGLHLFPSALGVVLFPRFVSAWAHSAERASAELKAALRFVGVFSAGVFLAGWVWAHEAVRFVFGGAYDPAADLLRILLGTLGFMALNSILSLALVARGGEGAYAATLALATAVNLLFTALFVPRFGADAAAWASLGSEALLCIGCSASLRRSARNFLPLGEWSLLLVGTAAAVAGLWAVKQTSPIVALILTVAALVGGLGAALPVASRDIARQLVFRRGLGTDRDV
jgi:O-antigen/teichoic acid export membrane protein